jgi:hypothetical protein
MTRADYLAGKVSHDAYYLGIAKASGVSFKNSRHLFEVRQALGRGDIALNNMPLALWDNWALARRAEISEALRLAGDSWSLAGAVCVLKAAARAASKV